MNIIIFSRPVHSGKTTDLLQWCKQEKNISGVLMPDIDGKRKILNLETNEIIGIECTDPDIDHEVLIPVGPYYFYRSVFEKFNSLLPEMFLRCPNWLVIDEVGKLELDEKGFYPAVKKILGPDSYWEKDKKNQTKLLLVVREGLCKAVITFFKIKQYTIVNCLEDL